MVKVSARTWKDDGSFSSFPLCWQESVCVCPVSKFLGTCAEDCEDEGEQGCEEWMTSWQLPQVITYEIESSLGEELLSHDFKFILI